jgi:hypothetical protein
MHREREREREKEREKERKRYKCQDAGAAFSKSYYKKYYNWPV